VLHTQNDLIVTDSEHVVNIFSFWRGTYLLDKKIMAEALDWTVDLVTYFILPEALTFQTYLFSCKLQLFPRHCNLLSRTFVIVASISTDLSRKPSLPIIFPIIIFKSFKLKWFVSLSLSMQLRNDNSSFLSRISSHI